jgi:hypothetical protein
MLQSALRLLLFVVAFVLLLIWAAAGTVVWVADWFRANRRSQPRPPFRIPTRTSDEGFGKTAAVAVLLFLVVGALGGSSEQEGSADRVTQVSAPVADEAPAVAEAEQERERVSLLVKGPEDGRRTTRGSITVRGKVTDGSTVWVNGKRATVRGRRYSARIPLSLGVNGIDVEAARDDLRTASTSVSVTRKAKPEPLPEPEPLPAAEPEPEVAAVVSECHSSYEGACLDPNASDYDCEGGSGDGPEYTGTVTVVGPDEYDLERDDDGIACDAS